MTWAAAVALLAGSVIVSAALTGLLRRYAVRRNVLDIPNVRSAHKVPAPRGGGVAIVVVFLAVIVVLALMHAIEGTLATALVGGGAIVAAVGFADDHREVPVVWRLVVHFGGAAWALYWLGGLPPLMVFGRLVDFGWLGHLGGVVYLVWLLNLYNFMDGIDGIAGLEATTVGLSAAMLLFPVALDAAWLLPALLAAATIGFLVWNWPPAKIFSGDVGSGALGILLGALSLYSARLKPDLFWAWLILLGVFIVDATLTIVRRTARGERPHQAHSSHAYQHAARRYGAHAPVTMSVGAINAFWLLPLAIAVAAHWIDGLAGLAVAYLPLAWVGWRYKAGLPAAHMESGDACVHS